MWEDSKLKLPIILTVVLTLLVWLGIQPAF